MAKIAIVYYSSTGNTYELAKAVAHGATAARAEVRILKAAELAPDAAIDSNPGWRAHIDATKDVPVATPEDLDWADGFLFGSPTRFGLPAAQLKQFIDQCGGMWFTGKLQDKAAGAFGGAGNAHGGQESTLLAMQNIFYHWGSVIVPIGYTDPALYAAGGNPYGVSFTDQGGAALPAETLAAARLQGARIARYSAVLAANRAALSPQAA
jgi:NAD(P)H dehydrogenase (quinone)